MQFVKDWQTLKNLAKTKPDQTVRLFGYGDFNSTKVLPAAAALAYMRSRLHAKISQHDARPAHWRNVAGYERMIADVAHDRRMIAEYREKRIRHSGSRNLLRHPVYKMLYPEMDNQPFEW